ncbi:hypothetical protein NHN26_06400 [Rhodovulum tesquicola]|uniref:MerR family transcriptional regulator n=1 Tax=Rhodovulum tesquicola TaxID=540254 RepID=UPI002096E785|nr:hypothetical protein [Rhodovulum tesquicola]MCO8144854.1 hypothetical protein [Rhodovulum tesquicola]
MNEIEIKQKIRFSTVAAAIDLTPKAFRNWLQRYELHLSSDYRTRGWTEFTVGDVAVLALTRELVSWGVGVEAANEFAYVVVMKKAKPLFHYRNTPAAALLQLFSGYVICLHAPDDAEGPRLILDPDLEGYCPGNFKSALWVNVHHVVNEAFARLASRTEDEATA